MENVASGGAKGDADTELAAALGHGVGDNSIHAEHRQSYAEEREKREERRHELAFVAHLGEAEPLVERTHLSLGEIRPAEPGAAQRNGRSAGFECARATIIT